MPAKKAGPITMRKLWLYAQDAWVIRSTCTDRPETFFESHTTWNTSPSSATVFRSFDAAERELVRAASLGFKLPGEVHDVVPLVGALDTFAAKAGKKG
jgi:hypothetical protein